MLPFVCVLLLACVQASPDAPHGKPKSPLASVHMKHVTYGKDGKSAIKVNVSSIKANDAWIGVQYSVLRGQASHDDWVGVFTPPEALPQQLSPVKYDFANISAEYVATGHGETRCAHL
jgi:hypothetical protein